MNRSHPKSPGGWLTLALAVAYAAVLAAVLWSSDPFRLAGSAQGALRQWFRAYVEPVAHLLAFMPLGWLMAVGRWPLRRGAVLGALLAYAVGSEAVQALVPQRSVQWEDALQNVAGLALGACLAAAARQIAYGSAPRCDGSTHIRPE